jgi:hypothetical protein
MRLKITRLAKIIVLLLMIWSVYAALSAIFGVAVYFPLRIAATEPIPEYRWQSVRVAILLTFAYYGLVYVFDAAREVFPIHFLKIYLLMLSISCVFIFPQHGVEWPEYFFLVFVATCASTLHLASKQNYRRYFKKR